MNRDRNYEWTRHPDDLYRAQRIARMIPNAVKDSQDAKPSARYSSHCPTCSGRKAPSAKQCRACYKAAYADRRRSILRHRKAEAHGFAPYSTRPRPER